MEVVTPGGDGCILAWGGRSNWSYLTNPEMPLSRAKKLIRWETNSLQNGAIWRCVSVIFIKISISSYTLVFFNTENHPFKRMYFLTNVVISHYSLVTLPEATVMDNQTPNCLVCQETPASDSNEKMVNAAVAFPSSQLLQGASKSAAQEGAFLEPPTIT